MELITHFVVVAALGFSVGYKFLAFKKVLESVV